MPPTGSPMDLLLLKHFCAVLEYGSVTRAAKAVHISQPALSRQMQALEAELDCPLFDRSVKAAVALTREGELFLHFARTTLAQRRALQADLNEISAKRRGRISITSPETLAHVVLPAYIRRYSTDNPDVDIRLLTANSSAALDLLRTGEADMCLLLESKARARPDITYRRWREGNYMLMAPKGHPLVGRELVSIEEVAAYRLIMPHAGSQISSRYKIDALFAEKGIVPNVCLEADSVPLRAEYVRIGFGVSFIFAAEETLRLFPGEVEYINLDHLVSPEVLVIGVRSEKALSPVAGDFLDLLMTPPEMLR